MSMAARAARRHDVLASLETPFWQERLAGARVHLAELRTVDPEVEALGLINMLADHASFWCVRRLAVKAMADMCPDAIRQHSVTSIKLLGYYKENVRRSAARDLGRVGECVSVLSRFASTDFVVPDAAEVALAKLGSRHEHALALAAALGDSDSGVRCEVLIALAKFEPATLAKCAVAVCAMLEDPVSDVRTYALAALGKMHPTVLERHSSELCASLGKRSWRERLEALNALGQLLPPALARHADAVAARTHDRAYAVRHAALLAMRSLPPAKLVQYADIVAAKLSCRDRDGFVHGASLEVLAKLEPAALTRQAGAVAASLGFLGRFNRAAALETLGKLPHSNLAEHAGVLIARLRDPDAGVRRAALQTLGKLDPQIFAGDAVAMLEEKSLRIVALRLIRKFDAHELVQHSGAILAMLTDSDELVRTMTLQVLCNAPPGFLAFHAEAVLARLTGDDSIYVRSAALRTLASLMPDAFAQHAVAVAGSLATVYPAVATKVLNGVPAMKGVNIRDFASVRGRLRLLRFRALFRAQKVAQYWLASTYVPGGPGFLRCMGELQSIGLKRKFDYSCHARQRG